MPQLRDTFTIADVMIPQSKFQYVAPGDSIRARELVANKKYSVVPASRDGENFESVFCTQHEKNNPRTITEERAITGEDYIPDAMPLAQALGLFESREWYLALRGNRVSGLITYWDLNSRELRIQLYAVLTRLEELARDVLANDGCGVSGPEGLVLTPETVRKVSERFESARKDFGGNRFVDELDFHDVQRALRNHSLWRDHVYRRLGRTMSNTEYDRLYGLTNLRDSVMHGRVVFPTYSHFKAFTCDLIRLTELIGHLTAYDATPTDGLPAG